MNLNSIRKETIKRTCGRNYSMNGQWCNSDCPFIVFNTALKTLGQPTAKKIVS